MEHAITGRSVVRREVVSFFLDHPSVWAHAGELGRAIGRPAQVVGRHLTDIEQMGVLESRVVGRRREYRLTLDPRSRTAKRLRAEVAVDQLGRANRAHTDASTGPPPASMPERPEPSTSHPLHFEDLDPRSFEDLVRGLLSPRRSWKSLDAIGRVGGDEGTDIEGVEWVGVPANADSGEIPPGTATRTWRVQVKRHRSLSPAGLRRIVDAMNAGTSSPPYGFLLATSADLTPAARRTFIAAALEAGVAEPELWTRSFLEDELRRPENAGLLRRFFGIGSGIEGTVAMPPALEASPGQGIPLLGRDEELRRLQHGSGDWIILGRPGVGKTRLAYEAGALRFVSHASPADIAASIRLRRPRRVVVDDAGLEPERLDAVLALRTGGLDFDVIAIAWPEQSAAIRRRLHGATEISLDLVERSEMDQIVRQLGIENYFLRGEILRQAEGRPGWAIAIGAAARNGDIESVITGRGLFDQVEPILRRVSRDTEATLAVVSVLAAIGSATAQDIEAVADLLRLSVPELQHALNDAATCGIVERYADGQERWEIRPEPLRQSIVLRRFFELSVPAVRIEAILERWPQRQSAVLHSVVRAAAAGSRGARNRIESWLGSKTVEPSVIAEYASLDEPAARRAVRHALEGGLAGSLDVLKVAAGQYALPEAVTALLDMGVGDDRPMHSSTDHPVRVLGDLATRVFPNGRTSFALRDPLLRIANNWLEADPITERQVVWARLANRLLEPTAEGTWMQLGSPRTAQMMGGFESAENLRRLSEELWPQVAGRLRSLESRALVEVVDTLDAWLRLARGIAGAFGAVPRPEQVAVAREMSSRMLADLASLAPEHPGVALKLRRTTRLLRVRVAVPLPTEFRLLTWDLWRWWEPAKRHAEPALERLGECWATEPPGAVMGRVAAWRREASVAGANLFPAVSFAMRGLANRAADREPYVRAAFEAGLCGEAQGLVQAALSAAEVAPDWLREAISGPCRKSVLAAVLADGSPDEIARWAVGELTGDEADLVELALRRQGGETVASELLSHPIAAVRGRASLEFKIGDLRHGVPLDARLYPKWSRAFLDAVAPSPSDLGEFHVMEILGKLVDLDPDLAEAWLCKRLDELAWDAFHFAIPYQADAVFRRLPLANRERLARRFAHAPFKSALIPFYMAGDAPLVDRLLAAGILDAEDVLHGVSSIGEDFEERRAVVEALSATLIKHGASPEAIAGTAYSGGWMGDESQRHSKFVEMFSEMARSESEAVASVGRAGVTMFEAERERALLSERRERIVGLDR
jgi:DNA-binding transcriptional ArsR family regulator